MSIAAMNWAWSVRALSPTDRLTLLALADFADADGHCFPSQGTLADRVGVSARTIMRVLSGLEDRGLFTRERRTLSRGQRTSDGYRLSLGDNLSPDTGDVPKVTTVSPTREPSGEPSLELDQDLPNQSQLEKRIVATDSQAVDEFDEKIVTGIATRAGVQVGPVAHAIRQHTGRDLAAPYVVAVASWIIAKARTPPAAPMRYVIAAITASPFEVQAYVDEMGFT